MQSNPLPIEKYGKSWPDGAGDLDIELLAFKMGLKPEEGGLGKAQHFKNVVNILWPYHKTKNKNGFYWHPWADWMIERACEENYLAISGPKSSAKTSTMAMWGLVNWLCAPHETLVLVTTTSVREARKRLWGSIRERYMQVPGLPGKLVDSMGKIVLDISESGEASDRSSITLVPSSPDKEKEATAKLIGLKNKRVFLIIDEATDVTNSVFEAISNLNANPQFQCVALGNFNSQYDPFGVFSTPKDGWNSVTVDHDEWETKTGKCIHLDGLKTPNIEHDDKWPFLLTSKQVKYAIDNEGENSLSFWRFIRSFPAPVGSEEGIYSEADFRKYDVSKEPKWTDQALYVAGFDPAFTNGGDRSVLAILKYGQTDESGPALALHKFHYLREDVTKPEPRNFQIAREVQRICSEVGVPPERLAIDATGAGDPFCDILAETWSPRIVRIKFGERASQLPVSITNPIKGSEKYTNRVTELWFAGVEYMRSGQLKGIMADLAKEMTGRKYTTTSGGKVTIEPKRDYKLRLGRSPDLADAFFLGVDLARQKLGIVAGSMVGGKMRSTWETQVKKLDSVSADNTFLTG
jgi:hypothetical protein